MIKTTIKQKIGAHIFSAIPFSVVQKLTGAKLIIPYYHMVSDEQVPHVRHLYAYKNIKQFRSDLDFFLKHFNPVSLLELLDSIKNGSCLPAKAFLLTFDDGFREMFDIVAPILKEKGVPATFFVNSAFIDNKELCYLNKLSITVERMKNQKTVTSTDEIEKLLMVAGVPYSEIHSGILSIPYKQKDLADKIAELLNIDLRGYLAQHKPYLTSDQIAGLIRDNFTIGTHSIDHPVYGLLSLEEQLYQTKESMKVLKEKYYLNYYAFAFPHKDNNVSKMFFSEIYNSGSIDISFGTSGMMQDCFLNHFQRVSMERPLMQAVKIIRLQLVKKFYRLMMGNNKIIRR